MNIKNKLFLALILLFQAEVSFGQQDTIFWFAAPEVSSAENDNPIYLNLTTYADPAQVTISQPANVAFTDIVVNVLAGSSSVVDLSAFLGHFIKKFVSKKTILFFHENLIISCVIRFSHYFPSKNLISPRRRRGVPILTCAYIHIYIGFN